MLSKKLLKNTFLLTASSLLMSGIGMLFQAWLARRLSAAGLGLYQLTISVQNLCATLAISGIRFASTRLISEELGGAPGGSVQAAMRRCLGYGAVCGSLAGALLYVLAEPLGFLWIGDARTVLSLRVAAFSMPCVSLCAAISGYFTACGRVWKPAVIHLAEQLAGIVFVARLLSLTSPGDVEQSCAAVNLGRCLADLLSLGLLLCVYLHDRRRHYAKNGSGERLSLRMLHIAVPLALSAYTRSALTTLQQLLVPKGLRASGLTANAALAGYGVVQGMVMPLLFFPACLLGSAAELIVPELTAQQLRRDTQAIKNTAGALLRLSLRYSLAVAGILFFCADILAGVIYHSREAAQFLRLLSPLVPVMYFDMAVDGCLKGLGQQVWSMGVNILESALGLGLLWLLLPRYGLAAYLGILYFCELINLALSVFRLWRCLRAAPDGAHPPYAEAGRCAYTKAP